MHIVAPACVVARILVFLQRTHAPSGALSVRDMAVCMSHARIDVIGMVVDIADSMGHPLVMAIRRAITKIPHEVPSVCCADFHTALVWGGSVTGAWGGSARRASVSRASSKGVRSFIGGGVPRVLLSSQMACFHAHMVSAALWCLFGFVHDSRESSRSWAFSCRRRMPVYQWTPGMFTGKHMVEAVVGLLSSGLCLRVYLNEVQSLFAIRRS